MDEGRATFSLMPSSTPGGNWSGSGIIDDSLGVFDADTAGVGTHVIKYTTPGVCFAIDSVSILVKQWVLVVQLPLGIILQESII